MIKAVVFDMDGVLIDAREWHYQALNRALEYFGFAITPEEHRRRFDGLPTREKLAILSSESNLPTGLHSFINELKQEFTEELVVCNCRPRFEHEFMLRTLRADGYRLGLASNSIRSSILLMLSKAGLGEAFDSILSNEDVTNAKPDPEIYLASFEILGVSPECALVVEDNPFGVEAAHAAGAHVLEVRGPDDVNLEAIRLAMRKSS